MVKIFPKKKRKEKNSLNLMISFQRKYCDRIFPFYFYFSHFGEILQLGTNKKKNTLLPTSGRTFFLEPYRYLWTRSPTKWFYPLLLIWTFSSSEVTSGFSCGPSQAQKLPAVFLVDLLKLQSDVRFFWWTRPTTKWVCTRLFLYGPSLDPLVKKERASERAKEADTQ